MRFFVSFLFAISFGFSGLTFAQDAGHPSEPWTAHLKFKGGALHVHAHFPAVPQQGQASTLLLETHDGNTHALVEISEQISVVLWMPSMGHGSAPTKVVHATDENGQALIGQYVVQNVNFIMGGKWELRVVLADANGQSETQVINVDLNDGHMGVPW